MSSDAQSVRVYGVTSSVTSVSPWWNSSSLARSAAALARTATVEQVAEAAVSMLAAWGASVGTLYVVERDQLRLQAAVGLDESFEAELGTIPLDLEAPSPEAARRRSPVVVQDGTDFDRRYPALAAHHSRRDDSLEPFLAEIVLERLGGELHRAGLAAIADEPQAGRVEPEQSGRIHAVAADHRPFAHRTHDDEAIDLRAVARDGLAGEPLANAKPNSHRFLGTRRKRRRFDPEIMRGEARGQREQQRCRESSLNGEALGSHGRV